MERVEKFDQILLAVYVQVASLADPGDNPVTIASVQEALELTEQQLSVLLARLTEEGLIKISPIGTPPLLYLTRSGLARVRRKQNQAA